MIVIIIIIIIMQMLKWTAIKAYEKQCYHLIFDEVLIAKCLLEEMIKINQSINQTHMTNTPSFF
jgi:hypothetical protein